MQIYNQKKGLYIQAYEPFDNNKRYQDEYTERANTTPYYNPEVFKARKKWIESRIDLTKAFDYGAGMSPYYTKLPENKQPMGMYDKYTEPYQIFNTHDYFNSESILLLDVLEHLYDPHLFLRTIPHKNLLISIPCVPYKYFYHLDQIKDWKHLRAGEHLLYANEEGIYDILEECGWTIKESGEWEGPIREDILCLIASR